MNILSLIIITLISINSYGQNYNFEQGIDYTKKEEYDKAIEYFTKAIDQEPKSGIYYYWRAVCYNHNENNADALRDVNAAINYFSKKEKNTYSSIYEFRGDIYLKLDEQQKAIDDYSMAIKLNPKDDDPYFKRANIYFNNEDYILEEADYKKVLSIDESSVRAYAGLSRNYLETGKLVEAELNANKAIKISPEYSEGYFYRGLLNIKKKEYELAIDDLITSYIQSEFDEYKQETLLANAHYNYTYTISKLTGKIANVKSPDKLIEARATISEYACNYLDALNDYDLLIESADIYDKPKFHFYKAKIYGWLENYKSEISELNNAIEIDSTESVLYGFLGVAYNGEKNFIMADECYSKAISLNNEISWFYSYRAMNKIEMQLYEDGLKDLNHAIAIEKSYYLAYYQRALLYKNHFNQLDKAKQDFEFIEKNDTNLEKGNNLRQFALFYLNNKTEAINWENKILENDPNFLKYYEAAKLYALLNNKDKSIEYLKLAVLKGYKKCYELENEKDFNNVKSSIEFKNIVQELKLEKRDNKNSETIIESSSNNQQERVSINMKNRGSGTYEIPCTINQLKLNMIFDTGASDISISQTEVDFMLKNGYLNENDIVGSSNYIDANGDIELGTNIILRQVDFGGLVLKNVRASVTHNKNAPLLFGQSALSKYGKITIDNAKKTITISK